MNRMSSGMEFFAVLGVLVAFVWHPLSRRRRVHWGLFTDMVLGLVGGVSGGLLSGFAKKSSGALFVLGPYAVGLAIACALGVLAMALYVLRLNVREEHRL